MPPGTNGQERPPIDKIITSDDDSSSSLVSFTGGFIIVVLGSTLLPPPATWAEQKTGTKKECTYHDDSCDVFSLVFHGFCYLKNLVASGINSP